MKFEYKQCKSYIYFGLIILLAAILSWQKFNIIIEQNKLRAYNENLKNIALRQEELGYVQGKLDELDYLIYAINLEEINYNIPLNFIDEKFKALQITYLKPAKIVPKGNLQVIPYTIIARGDYNSIKNSLENLEKGTEMVELKAFSIKKEEDYRVLSAEIIFYFSKN